MRLFSCFRIGAVAVLVSGCSGGDRWTEAQPETAEASGVVTLDGEPVEGAAIIFSPEGDGEHAGQALTDSSGRFTASAFSSKTGLVPGKYAVAISKTIEQPAPRPTGPDAAHVPPEGLVTWVNVMPAKYFNPYDSGLKAEIPEEGRSDLNFELKK